MNKEKIYVMHMITVNNMAVNLINSDKRMLMEINGAQIQVLDDMRKVSGILPILILLLTNGAILNPPRRLMKLRPLLHLQFQIDQKGIKVDQRIHRIKIQIRLQIPK
jgi:hypothetical protein